MMNHASNGPLNFDSPSTAAAMGALNLSNGLDLNLHNVASLGNLNQMDREDDKLKKLEGILDILKAGSGKLNACIGLANRKLEEERVC